MYGVLLVDDEAYFRQYIKTCIPWDDYGLVICGEADSGEEALDLLNINPDIVLADIHMSGMNGLEFAKKAKERKPQLQIIIITGYNEFEYAKQAVKLGICSFICKPFDKEELIESLKSCKNELSNIQTQTDFINQLKSQIKDTTPLARDLVLYRMVSGWYDSRNNKNLPSDLRRMNIALTKYPYLVITMESHLQSSDEQLKEELKRLFGQDMILFLHEQQCTLLLPYDEAMGDSRIVVSMQKVIDQLSQQQQGEISAGIGLIVRNASEWKASYDASCIALRNKFLLGTNRVISYSAMRIADKGDELYPFGLKNDLLMYTRLLDWENVCKTFADIYDSIKNQSISIDYIYILYTQLLSTCFSCLAEYDKRSEDVFGAEFRPFERILSCRSLGQIHEFILSVFHQAITYLEDKKQEGSTNTVRKIKEYIDLNYNNGNLTVDKIAASVYFHPSYIRFLFKQKVGVTINEYLTDVRMEHAKKLLMKGCYHLTEVSAMVGYTDAAYFSKCFKKYYKFNPSDFEKLSNLL